MEFGRVARLDGIRFELPPDDPRSSRSLRPGAEGAVYAGAPIWASREWVGKVYPEGTASRDFLKHYGRQFNSIELNSTFYGIPDSATIRGWCESVPESFRFCPKLSREISHVEELGATGSLLQDFCRAANEFGDRLGTCFLQLHPGFGPERLGALARFLRAFPRSIPLAVEFRHPAWFENHRLLPEAFDLLAGLDVATVITDVAGRRDVLHASLTHSTAMIRFVGNELHPSDFARIDDWVERLRSWLGQGLERAYFFLHHPTFVNIPELAADFTRKMNARAGLRLRDCTELSEPRQLALF